MTCGQKRPCNPCLKGRTTAVAQMNIRANKKEQTKLQFSILTSNFFISFLIIHSRLIHKPSV
jgi:hypothetical protein